MGMNLTIMTINCSILIIMFLIGLCFCGCESDPILSPQVEVSEESGSYGNTNIEINESETSSNKVNNQQKRRIRSKFNKNTNPKLF